MSVIGSNALAGASGQGGGAGYVIEKSLRFTKGDGAYLSRTFSGTPNKKKFTFSVWFKGAVQHSHQYLLQTQHVSSNYFEFTLNAFKLQAYNAVPGINVTLARQLRDPSAWYHAVLAVDTTQAVEADRLKIYLNGVHQTDYISGGSTFPAQNAEFELPNRDWYIANAYFNSTTQSTNFFDGYMAEFHYVDGEAKDVTDFGAFDSNGVWQAAEYTGSHGTNGFHLDFADGSNLGNDAAGSNNWTANNLTGVAAEVSLSDVTIQSGGSIISGGNPGYWFDGDKDTYAYANLNDNTNYIQWAPSGGYTTPGYIWIQGGDGNGNGLDSLTVTINGSTVSHSAVVSNETYSSAAYGWGKWFKYAVSGNTLNSVRVTGAFTLLRQISTVADPTHSVLGISDDNDVPVLLTGDPSDLDLLFDSPSNGDPANDTEAGGVLSSNYCTWNPLSIRNGGGTMELVDGNLNFGDQGTASRYGSVAGSIAVNSGKWFVECTLGSGTGLDSTVYFGLLSVEDQAATNSAAYFNTPGCIAVKGNEQAYKQGVGSTASYASGIAVGDTLSIAFNCDDGTSTWYLNGTSLGSFPYSFDSSKSWTPFASDWSNNQPCSEFILNCGQRPFSMTPPTGYKAICTANLPTPDVPDGSAYFDAALWTGNGTSQSITGLEFSPDFVWVKGRNAANGHNLQNIISGTDKFLQSHNTNAEGSNTTKITAFNSDGFSLGSNAGVNNNNDTYVGWAWDAGSSTVTNTDGDITSSVRANPSAGFSIVKWTSITWTGSATNRQVGHGLGAAPAFIITKGMDNAAAWYSYHKDLDATNPNDYYISLNTSSARGSLADSFGPNIPDSTTFGDRLLGYSAGEDVIAYCWTPVAGYSAFGKYTGNANANGPFVYTGFRPKFLLIKGQDIAVSWLIYDAERNTFNLVDDELYADRSDSENGQGVSDGIDFCSTGFKVRSADSWLNSNNNNYIYAAFAENPFQGNGGIAR